MTRLTRRRLNQKAVLWAFSAYDENGEPTVSAAAEIDTRWEQEQLQQITEDGTPIGVTATVDVAQDVAEGSILRLGALADLPDPVTDGLLKVVAFDKIPDIKGRVFQRSVTVQKWRGGLPTLA